MSLTNTYENNVLKKLLGQDTWTTISANLKLRVFSVSPGEDGNSSNVVGSSSPLGTFKIEGNRVATSSSSRQIDFTSTGSVVALALCESDGTPIWYEEITGTARRTYSNGDSLVMPKISFGFAGSAVASGLTNAILDQLFNSGRNPGFWPTQTVIGNDSTAGLYLALYDGDPGFDGNSGSEVGPGTRSKVYFRESGSWNWTISNNIAYNAKQLVVGGPSNKFPSECRVTHMALRSGDKNGSSLDYIYWRGALLSPQYMRPDDKFIVEPGQLTLALD